MHADVFRPGESRLENRKLRRLGDARIFSSTSAVATARHGAATRGVLRGGASKSSDAIESSSSESSIKSTRATASTSFSSRRGAAEGGVARRARRAPGRTGTPANAVSARAPRARRAPSIARARARRRRTIPPGGGAAPGGRSAARSKTAPPRSRRDRETLDARLEQACPSQASDEHARVHFGGSGSPRTRVAARARETRRIISGFETSTEKRRSSTRTMMRDAPLRRARSAVGRHRGARTLSRSVFPNGGARLAALGSAAIVSARRPEHDPGVREPGRDGARHELRPRRRGVVPPPAATTRRARRGKTAEAPVGDRTIPAAPARERRPGQGGRADREPLGFASRAFGRIREFGSRASDIDTCASTNNFSRGARIAVATTSFAFAFLALASCITGKRTNLVPPAELRARFHSRRSFFSFRRSATSPNSARPQRKSRSSRVVAGAGSASRNARIVSSVARASSIAAPSAMGTSRSRSA